MLPCWPYGSKFAVQTNIIDYYYFVPPPVNLINDYKIF